MAEISKPLRGSVNVHERRVISTLFFVFVMRTIIWDIQLPALYILVYSDGAPTSHNKSDLEKLSQNWNDRQMHTQNFGWSTLMKQILSLSMADTCQELNDLRSTLSAHDELRYEILICIRTTWFKSHSTIGILSDRRFNECLKYKICCNISRHVALSDPEPWPTIKDNEWPLVIIETKMLEQDCNAVWSYPKWRHPWLTWGCTVFSVRPSAIDSEKPPKWSYCFHLNWFMDSGHLVTWSY